MTEAVLRRSLTVKIPTNPGEPVSVIHAHRHQFGTSGRARRPEAIQWQYTVRIYTTQARNTKWYKREEDFNPPLVLTVDYYFRDNRRRDSHNYAKVIIDGVADALCIDDRYIRYRDGVIAVDRANPRVVLHIEEEAGVEV